MILKQCEPEKVTQWYPDHIKAEVYNDRTGKKEELTLHKSKTVIIENPLYAIMNEKKFNFTKTYKKIKFIGFDRRTIRIW